MGDWRQNPKRREGVSLVGLGGDARQGQQCKGPEERKYQHDRTRAGVEKLGSGL